MFMQKSCSKFLARKPKTSKMKFRFCSPPNEGGRARPIRMRNSCTANRIFCSRFPLVQLKWQVRLRREKYAGCIRQLPNINFWICRRCVRCMDSLTTASASTHTHPEPAHVHASPWKHCGRGERGTKSASKYLCCVLFLIWCLFSCVLSLQFPFFAAAAFNNFFRQRQNINRQAKRAP